MDRPSPRILLVEDHEASLRATTILLRSQGFEVEPTCTAEEALEVVSSRSFDLAIIDIGLPGKDGFALMAELRNKGIAGIACTGYGMPDDLDRYWAAGFAKHVLKPFVVEQLLPAIQELMDSKALQVASITAGQAKLPGSAVAAH